MYIVVGKCLGREVYWNRNEKGWYLKEEMATLYPNMESALSGQYYAESILTPEERVVDIDVKKIEK